jgi:mono/diheme cytochrome c family protein
MNRTLIIGAIVLLGMTTLPAISEAQGGGQARKLINAQGCKACHTLEADGGNVAASFEEIRAKRSRAEIRLQLINPGGKHGNDTIPDFSHLSSAEIEALVSFIQPEP